jgi:hypothetical protein
MKAPKGLKKTLAHELQQFRLGSARKLEQAGKLEQP